MSYWHQMYPRRRKAERLELDNGAARFEALLAKELKPGDRKFAESLHKQLDAGLTPKQIECVERMEGRYSDEAIAARDAWVSNYKAEGHREIAMICAQYYMTTSYFRDLARSVLTDENFRHVRTNLCLGSHRPLSTYHNLILKYIAPSNKKKLLLLKILMPL